MHLNKYSQIEHESNMDNNPIVDSPTQETHKMMGPNPLHMRHVTKLQAIIMAEAQRQNQISEDLCHHENGSLPYGFLKKLREVIKIILNKIQLIGIYITKPNFILKLGKYNEIASKNEVL